MTETIPADIMAAARNCYEAMPLSYDGWDEDAVILCIARAIMAHTARQEERIKELEAIKTRKQFPILGSRGATVDWQLVADHGAQAYRNHGQTVARLAERGGLAWQELYAVLHDKPLTRMEAQPAIEACRAMEARYLAALRPAPREE